MTTRDAVFDPRLAVGLIAAGIVAFAAFMLLLAYGGDFRMDRSGRAHALSGAATGFRGLVRLAELTDRAPRLLRDPAGLDTEDLVVLAIEPGTEPGTIAALMETRLHRPTLLILPKWRTMPDADHPGWVRHLGTLAPEEAAAPLGDWHPIKVREQRKAPRRRFDGRGVAEGVSVTSPDRIRTISGEDQQALVGADGAAILAQVGDQPHYILADPDLLNNKGLKDARGAAAAVALLDVLNSTDNEGVVFDLTTNGLGAGKDALRLAFEPPFVAMTIAIFAAALLAGLQGAFRFGPEVPEERAIALGKAALVENSAGLFRQARREHRAGGAYAELLRATAARSVGAPPSLRGAELDRYLDRLTPADAAPFSRLADDLRVATGRETLVRAAQALFQWKKDRTL